MNSADQWDRFDLSHAASLAPVFRARGAGIYVLEFANGEYYVGKTTNPTQRLTTHVRRWGDVSAILFRDVAYEDLDSIERATIRQRRAAGWKLRNVKHNPGHAQPSTFDDVLPVVEQHHWALGNASYDLAELVVAAKRDTERPTKLTNSILGSTQLYPGLRVAEAVLLDLASVIESGIPEVVSTERTYWTITDYPATSGGRFATLNVGDMEILFFPRSRGDHSGLAAILNVAPDDRLQWRIAGGYTAPNFTSYRASGPVTHLIVPLGRVYDALQHPTVLASLRKLVLMLMRSSTSAKFARWHSAELARRAFAIIADKQSQ